MYTLRTFYLAILGLGAFSAASPAAKRQQSCEFSHDCTQSSYACSNGICIPPRDKRQEGDSCASDNDCDADFWCFHRECRVLEPIQTGPPEDGAPSCKVHDDCEGGKHLCDPMENLCVPIIEKR